MSDTQHFDEWIASASSGPHVLILDERILHMFAWTAIYGPANCWTGDTGTAAAMIRELLRERAGLKEQIERLEDERNAGRQKP